MNVTEKFVAMLEAKQDATWDKYSRILAKVKSNTKANDLLAEMERLHQARTSRTLMTKSAITPENVINANLIDISTRSRLVELNNNVGKQYRLLTVAQSTIEGHLKSNYSSAIADAAGKTVGEKKAFVDAILSDGTNVLDRMEKIREIAEALIMDIDKTSWSLSSVVKLLELGAYRENIIKQVSI